MRRSVQDLIDNCNDQVRIGRRRPTDSLHTNAIPLRTKLISGSLYNLKENLTKSRSPSLSYWLADAQFTMSDPTDADACRKLLEALKSLKEDGTPLGMSSKTKVVSETTIIYCRNSSSVKYWATIFESIPFRAKSIWWSAKNINSDGWLCDTV